MRTKILMTLILVLLIMATGCAEKEALLENELKTEIRDVVLEGEAWWNKGNIEGYMGTYWKSPDLRFASGGKVTFGWQNTLDGYLKRYPDRAAMAWKLEREHDQPHGLFTLLLRRFDESWRIVHDHTSSAGAVEN